MKFKYILTGLLFILSFYACKKDLGNYDYNPPSAPVLKAFKDSTFKAVVGDSLILKPEINLEGANPLTDLLFQWDITGQDSASSRSYTGYPLRMLYSMSPTLHTAKLTITDKRNDIKYFIPFRILGTTQFSVGKTVLSVDNGVTKLSFIKPDNKTILADLYTALHGENLPSNPLQLFAKPLAYQPGTAEDYWVICQDPAKSSVIIDGNTMLRKRYFNEQFFNPPAVITPGYFEASTGLPTAVINSKLYISIFQTAPFAPDFGKFSNPQSGNYTLSKYFTRNGSFYFGFDLAAKAFVSFNGSGDYMGTDYKVDSQVSSDANGLAFDPKNVGMSDLIFMKAVSGTSYAFFKNASGAIEELSFNIQMDNYDARTIKPINKRTFKGSSLVLTDTKWQRSAVDVFYFSSNDKIYRYNPVNEDLRALDANFGGKKVTMIQLSADGNKLTAGVEGSILTLDVSVGNNGIITQTISGIPGSPVDIVIKN